MSRLREENRKIRSDFDELQLQYDDEVYNGGAWKKEKERFETKIQDLTKAYEVCRRLMCMYHNRHYDTGARNDEIRNQAI